MSDYIKDNFLPEDHKEAISQQNCFYYNNHLSERALELNQMDKALVYHENALRSLKKLAKLRDKHDEAWYIIKRIEADQTMKELVQKQLVKAYD